MNANTRHYLNLARHHVRKAQACGDLAERRMRLSIAAFCIGAARASH